MNEGADAREGACLLAQSLTRRICGRCAAWRTLLTLSFASLAFDQGAHSEWRPRSEGLAARRWRFRSASSALVSGITSGTEFLLGWNNSWHIEPRFANALVCARLFAQDCNIWLSSLRLSRARASTRAGACVSRASSPPSSLVPSHTRRCTWRGGKRVECLVNLESASLNAPIFNIQYSRMPYAFQLECA